jgi:ribonuclease G
VLGKKQPILVQILKEPISTKGPRLSCEITIPGRFLVISPFASAIAVSKKISSAEERKRLHLLVESIRPKHFGVIVRTAAEGKKVADLHEEMSMLMEKWEDIQQQMKNAKPPQKLLSELDKTTSILRDLLTDSFNRIIVNDKQMYANIKTFLGSIAPEKVKIVQLHRSSKSIFDAHGVTKQIKSSFGKTATMSSGAYVVIEHTEAMHVVDVNSGHKMRDNNKGEAVLKVNLEAAEEVARQLRLRDIGGIIIIDFIDMRNPEHKKELLAAMRQHMKKDRAQHTILALSKFGLMQITRQRVRPEVNITTAELCPTCNGTGKVNATILLEDEIERDLNYILQSQPDAKLNLKVHPFVMAHLKRGFLKSFQFQWFKEHQRWIKIMADNDYALNTYKFFDQNEDEIRL